VYAGGHVIKNDATIQNGMNLFRAHICIFITQAQFPLVLRLPVRIQIDKHRYASVKHVILRMIRIEIGVELQKTL
jgi:hypothetical protein